MISSDAIAATAVNVLPAVSAANTAAATSGWIDVRKYKGTLLVTVVTGAITGSFVGKLRSATDGSGTGAADITGATHTSVSTADQVKTIAIPATSAVGGYLQYVGTVTTGPVLIGVTMHAHPG